MSTKNTKRDAILDRLKGIVKKPHETLMAPRWFVYFTGSIEAALMLNQILFWFSEGRNGGRAYVYKSDREWARELCLSLRQVRNARLTLVKMDLITVQIHRAGGHGTNHYYLLERILDTKWQKWIDAGLPRCHVAVKDSTGQEKYSKWVKTAYSSFG